MKNTFIAILCITTFSCSKSFLSLTPPSNPTTNSFYRNAHDIAAVLNSAYASLQSDGEYRTAVWQVGEVRSDNSSNWEGGGNLPDAELDQFKESSSNSILNSMWLDTYHGILLCNIVIGRIEGIEMDVVLKKQFIGEALFLRALMYFNLIRTFGRVPLVLKETASVEEGYSQGRDAISTINDQLVNDLTTAISDLPVSYSGIDIGRVTSGAAKSLLGKILLTDGKFVAAAAMLKEVIDGGSYQLLPKYADLWKTTNANNIESIFEVQYKKGTTGTGSPYTNFFAPRGSDLLVTRIGFAYGRNLPTEDMVSAYEAGDLRKNASLAETYDRDGQIIHDPYTVKYLDVPYAELNADNNWVVIRYADVLLMYAEALNEMNGAPDATAYSMVNLVRQRAGLLPLNSGMDKRAFRLALEHERQVELAFEGHRWFDLVRTGRAMEVMNAHFRGVLTIQPYQLLFPVPQSQININPALITQNEGY